MCQYLQNKTNNNNFNRYEKLFSLVNAILYFIFLIGLKCRNRGYYIRMVEGFECGFIMKKVIKYLLDN